MFFNSYLELTDKIKPLKKETELIFHRRLVHTHAGTRESRNTHTHEADLFLLYSEIKGYRKFQSLHSLTASETLWRKKVIKNRCSYKYGIISSLYTPSQRSRDLT